MPVKGINQQGQDGGDFDANPDPKVSQPDPNVSPSEGGGPLQPDPSQGGGYSKNPNLLEKTEGAPDQDKVLDALKDKYGGSDSGAGESLGDPPPDMSDLDFDTPSGDGKSDWGDIAKEMQENSDKSDQINELQKNADDGGSGESSSDWGDKAKEMMENESDKAPDANFDAGGTNNQSMDGIKTDPGPGPTSDPPPGSDGGLKSAPPDGNKGGISGSSNTPPFDPNGVPQDVPPKSGGVGGVNSGQVDPGFSPDVESQPDEEGTKKSPSPALIVVGLILLLVVGGGLAVAGGLFNDNTSPEADATESVGGGVGGINNQPGNGIPNLLDSTVESVEPGCACQGVDYICLNADGTVTSASFNAVECGGSGVCGCREPNKTLACPDGTYADFNPACGVGGAACTLTQADCGLDQLDPVSCSCIKP